MILQSLAEQYDALAEREKVSKIGWSNAKVSYALVLDAQGQLIEMISLKVLSPDGKKSFPAQLWVPEQVKKASGIKSNFLCENASYFLGYDNKGKPDRTMQCFEAAKELHHEILDEIHNSNAERILKFFDIWDAEQAVSNEYIVPILKDLDAGANLVFSDESGNYLHKDKEIADAWKRYKSEKSSDAEKERCLVTGELAPIAILHPSIKGIRGAQSSGASLVSFNAASSESYGKDGEQGKNAPVSELAAFKYGAALNYMIADTKHVQYIGDTALVYWAEDADPIYQDIFSASLYGDDDTISDDELHAIMRQIGTGGDFNADGMRVKYSNKFYILGLSPNAARLSVRLFLQSEFGEMMQNLNTHNKRLEIVQPMGTEKKLPIWMLLNETANQNASNKTPPAPMAGAVLRSIILNLRYPESLYEMILLRIRAEHDINWKKAAIIKAFFLKNSKENDKMREVLTVNVSESKYEPYVLGRLFAILEMVQKTANPGIKATIRDKYFTSAASTPAHIFPILLSLAQHHLKKMSDGSSVYYDKLLTQVQNMIEDVQYPARLNLNDQGAFYLGYYHEKQALYTKSEKNVEEEINE